MSALADECLLKVACETPLPSSCASKQKAGNIPTKRPYTRAQAKFEQQSGQLPEPLTAPSSLSKKRVRKHEFEIFIDTSGENTAPSPSSKKSKPGRRVPLANWKMSAEVAPAPLSRYPGLPVPFSPSDPMWEDVENYDARACYMTPPSTPGPGSQSSSPGQAPRTPGGFSYTPPPPSPYPPSRNSARTPRRAPVDVPLPLPIAMVLYNVLGLEDWHATEVEIKAAYKKVSKDNHPDRVAAEQKGDATHFMQMVNAAKEVLLDNNRRRAYHRNGRLPWTT